MVLNMLLLISLSLQAKNVLIENARNASLTLKVLTAESLRPVNGYTSGPLWQALFMFTLQTKLTKISIKGANSCVLVPNTLTC